VSVYVDCADAPVHWLYASVVSLQPPDYDT
jgi:hypothetical protein